MVSGWLLSSYLSRAKEDKHVVAFLSSPAYIDPSVTVLGIIPWILMTAFDCGKDAICPNRNDDSSNDLFFISPHDPDAHQGCTQ